MIDVSLISLKKKLEQERALIPLVAQMWEVSAQGKDDDNTIGLILAHMQDAHAARSVWEALSVPERLCLFHLLGSGNPEKHKGITLSGLRKKTKLSTLAVEEAVGSLCARWYLVETGTISLALSLKSGPHLLEPATERGIFPYRECFSSLWQTGQEIFRPLASRSTSSLEQLLDTFTGDRLRYLANLCYVPMHAGLYPYNAYVSYSYGTSSSKEIQMFSNNKVLDS